MAKASSTRENNAIDVAYTVSRVFSLVIMLLHIYACPYSKVEESFNLQAIHDIIYSSRLSSYDHMSFPGVVPRTFIGALFIGLPLRFVNYVTLGFISKVTMQYLCRAALGITLWASWGVFQKSVSKAFGKDSALFTSVVSNAQFHLIFYSSRTLPNTFALALVLLAYSTWISRKPMWTLLLLSFCTIVFRADTILIYGPICLHMLYNQMISFPRMVLVGIFTAAMSLAVTVLIDSFFWNNLLWPEGQVLYFNTILNKSSEWGTSPFYWYGTSAIPRVALTTTFFLPLGILLKPGSSLQLDIRALEYLVVVLAYVALFSILPHKELRFIFNAFPLLNMIAGLGAAKIFYRQKNSSTGAILARMFVFGTIMASFCLTFVFLAAAVTNYPGGVAFSKLHQIFKTRQNDALRVHIDVPAAMTGVSRFGEQFEKWEYSKEEGLSNFSSFDVVLTSSPTLLESQGFETLQVFEVFKRFNYKSLTVETVPHTYLMQKK